MFVVCQKVKHTLKLFLNIFFRNTSIFISNLNFRVSLENKKKCKIHSFSYQNLIGKFLFSVIICQDVFCHCCCCLSLLTWSTEQQSKGLFHFISSLKQCLGAEGHLLVKGSAPVVTVFKSCLLSSKAFLVECKWPQSQQFPSDSSVQKRRRYFKWDVCGSAFDGKYVRYQTALSFVVI